LQEVKITAFAQLGASGTDSVEGVQGLRNDPISPAGAAYEGIGFQSLAQLLIALAIVVVLIRWLVPKYAAKFSKKSKEAGTNVDIQELGAVAL
jgi:flagellar biogenesis protein FliO